MRFCLAEMNGTDARELLPPSEHCLTLTSSVHFLHDRIRKLIFEEPKPSMAMANKNR
jgi:hypothetical protein